MKKPDIENNYLSQIAEKNILIMEAHDAILNLAPRIDKDNGGCFGDRQKTCYCTICKIRRHFDGVKLNNGRFIS